VPTTEPIEAVHILGDLPIPIVTVGEEATAVANETLQPRTIHDNDTSHRRVSPLASGFARRIGNGLTLVEMNDSTSGIDIVPSSEHE
jgi:hypothetical protein